MTRQALSPAGPETATIEAPAVRRSADAGEGPPVIFLLGAPRSGTTWLQELLGAHPAIAAPQETKVFHEYLAPLWETWRRQPLDDEGAWRDRRFSGPAASITEEEFRAWTTGLARLVYRRAIELKAGASVVLDKDPPNSLHLPLIRQAFPSARFIHLVRDGREVASSLLRVHHAWGPTWTPVTVSSAAQMWKDHVLAARGAGSGSASFVELRYEDLRADTVGSVGGLLARLGLAADEETLAAMVRRAPDKDEGAGGNALASSLVWGGEVVRRGLAVREPEGFIGPPHGWTEWSSRQRLQFARVAGDLLGELGYGSEHWTSNRLVDRVACAVTDASARVRRRGLTSLQRVAARR